MFSKIFLTTSFVLMAPMVALAHGAGNGGVDIKHADGSTEPAETYLERHTSLASNACDLMNLLPGNGDPLLWKRNLNKLVSDMYEKLPKAGDMIDRSLKQTTFYFLDLEPGDEIVYTADDGSPIATSKKNGAIRIKDEVYLDKKVWENYWNHRTNDQDQTLQLTRVLHEGLWSNYQGGTTHSLGRMVNEMLRLSGFYGAKGGPYEFKNMTGQQVATTLAGNGLSADDLANYSADLKISAEQFGTQLAYFDFQNKKTYNRTEMEGASKDGAAQFLAIEAKYEAQKARFINRLGLGESTYWTIKTSMGYVNVFNSQDAANIPELLSGETELYTDYYNSIGVSVDRYPFVDPRPAYLASIARTPVLCK